ncbi:Zn-dependent alcohol dehydrogenase [Helicobacter monodelphidis]|uniref:alcohol dehydrogenase catalytic domain-containing protein n=1 Tax=Helicobacter sp. 15-1451 TaxID=2004995 RepID=UPI000DCBC3F0|nr:alcohol dehydrogenase catalytic domain-containing protein [Helicobacter sp. 15-1451]RAX56803.1 Zn-dependent alcohol dehydrogenase [Helicobacter sp. 15-1451]
MNNSSNSRREFMKTTAIVGGAVALGGVNLFGANASNPLSKPTQNKPIKCKGWAAFDTSGVLKPYEFERRAVGKNDILIEIKFASICHSDIHQIKGDWGKQIYPQVPGHEIVGIVTQVGENVKNFKVGDRAGVGCMVDNFEGVRGDEQYDKNTLFTYGFVDKREPTGISQGGYSTHIVVNSHFAIKIPTNISFEEAVPLLCAGVTTYSPLMKYQIKKGDKVGIAGIGGLGHIAIKLAVSKGAKVYAFTTSKDKVADIKGFGASEVIVIEDALKNTQALDAYKGKLDYMISTIPVQFDVASYVSCVKPFGTFTQVGMPAKFELALSNFGLAQSRVNLTASLIGDMKETQEVMDYCAKNKIYPKIEVIEAKEINKAWQKVLEKKARYRYVIDSASI